jgi:CheY-like chemotaxis protein/HPt (histidine-containing phosphotransfer) domain-containing protein
MPEIDGLELARMIRAETRHDRLGLLVLTSTPRPAEPGRDAALRIAERLTKPVSPANLLAALARLLGQALAGDLLAAAPPVPTFAPTARLRILLAEDHPINQAVATGMLEKLGHAVTIVGDGQAAVAALADSPAGYDLVLMDLQMPVMDGFEAVAAIRAMGSVAGRARIIALTAHAIEGDRQRCLGSGFDDYLSKPIDPVLLAEVLARFASEAQAPAGPAPSRVRDPAGFDRSRALEHLAGDEQLLADVLAMFFEDWPRLSRGIRDAISGHDAAALRRHGHSAAGLADSLAVPAVAAAGRRLEGMGRAGVFDGAEVAFTDLELAVDRFRDDAGVGAATC